MLVCTLGISVLSATRDFAVALVDVTQHFARLSEALVTLLCPHELTDHPQAAALAPKSGASIVFERMSFAYPGDRHVFDRRCHTKLDRRGAAFGRPAELQAAVAARHVRNASSLRTRSVRRDVR